MHVVALVTPHQWRHEDIDRLLADEQPPTGVAARHHVTWTSERGELRVALWSDDDEPTWHLAPDGSLAAFAGQPVDPAGRSNDDVLRRLATERSVGPIRHVDGMFVAIAAGPDGSGLVFGDRFGLHPMYRATAGSVQVIANRSPLAAAAVHVLTGSAPSRDHLTATSVAVTGTAFGEESGFVGIRRVSDRHRLDIGGGAVREVAEFYDPWAAEDRAFLGDSTKIVDRIQERLCTSLSAAVRLGGGTLEAELTGGRDSRLVLALARLAAVESSMQFHTFGSPQADDARLAGWLAGLAGVDWEMRRSAPTDTSAEGFATRVATVAGEFGFGRVYPPELPHLLCSGMMGEALAAKYVGVRPNSLRRAKRRMESMISGDQHLVREEAVEVVARRAIEDLEDADRRGCPSRSLFDGYYLRQRERRWIGSRPDRWDRNLFPLYSPDAIASVFGLSDAERDGHLVHEELIRRAGLPVDDPAPLPAPPEPMPVQVPKGRPMNDMVPWPDMLAEISEQLAPAAASSLVDRDELRRLAADFRNLPRPQTMNVVNALTALAWIDEAFTVPYRIA